LHGDLADELPVREPSGRIDGRDFSLSFRPRAYTAVARFQSVEAVRGWRADGSLMVG